MTGMCKNKSKLKCVYKCLIYKVVLHKGIIMNANIIMNIQ